MWREPPPANFRPPLGFLLLLVVGVFAGALELLAGPEVDEEPPAPTMQELLHVVRREREEAQAEQALASMAVGQRNHAAASFCEGATAEECALAGTWVRALEEGDCSRAARVLALLLPCDALAIDDEAADRFRSAHWMTCPEIEDPAPPSTAP